MLSDFDHYLFNFHELVVEALARGVWFEQSSQPFPMDYRSPSHPLSPLPESAITARFNVAGIVCQVRTNPAPRADVLAAAHYCSQPLYHFAPELDGRGRVAYRLDLRERRGEIRSTLTNSLGRREATVIGIPALTAAKALVEPHLREISDRRRAK